MTMAPPAVVFALATALKAWEPLAVALSQGLEARASPPFALLLVMCEAIKLVCASTALLALDCSCLGVWPLLTFRCGLSATLLALCNHCLGFALHRIDPMLYQVVFKAVSVVGVAGCSRLVLGHRLGRVRYGCLGLLVVGMHLCVEPPPAEALTGMDAREWGAGLAACIFGSLALAVSTVLFEGATQAAPGQRLQHVAAFALWGLAANAAALSPLHWQLMTTHPARALRRVRPCDAVASLSIAAADGTMALFVAVLGANAYSFSRALALLLSGAISVVVVGNILSARFVVGAAAITTSAWAFQEHRRVAACATEAHGRMVSALCAARSGCCWGRDARIGDDGRASYRQASHTSSYTYTPI